LNFPNESSDQVSCLSSPDIREFSATSWRSIIGVVPQDPVLFTGTIASNIAFGNPDATREEIEQAAREANCEFVWGMPNGFDTESKRLQYDPLLSVLLLLTINSWSSELKWWSTPTFSNCSCIAEETRYSCP